MDLNFFITLFWIQENPVVFFCTDLLIKKKLTIKTPILFF